jgi:hypothetical protein
MRVMKPGGESSIVGNLTPGPRQTSASSCSNAGAPNLLDTSLTIDNQVFSQSHIAFRVAFERHGNPAIPADVANFLALMQAYGDDIITIEADTDKGYWRAAV